MYRTPKVARVLMIILLCGVVILPIALFLFKKPQVRTLVPSFFRVGSTTETRYSVRSDMPAYTLSLEDIRFLDYVTARWNIFADNTIADPRLYTQRVQIPDRVKISSIQFVLVDHVDFPIGTIVEGDGRDTPVRVVAKGDYVIQNDVLVVRVAVQFAAIGKSMLIKKFAWEDAFLRCAVNTLYYALGDPDPVANQRELVDVKRAIDRDMYTGDIFAWPFRITEVSP